MHASRGAACQQPRLQAKEDASELQEQSKALKARIVEAEKKEGELVAARDKALAPIGNLVHDSVPISDDEVSRAWEQAMGVGELESRR